jgi:hypothetical protein
MRNPTNCRWIRRKNGLSLCSTTPEAWKIAVVIHKVATRRGGTAHIATTGLDRTFHLPKSLRNLAICLLLLDHGSDKGVVVANLTKRTFWAVKVNVRADTGWG